MILKSKSIGLAVFLALASPSTMAHAQEPSKAHVEEAKKRFQRGKELYEENDYQAALAEFRRAYELAPTFRLLYDIAQVSYQLQDYPGALRHFTKFLQEGQGNIPAQQREDVQREIDRLKTRVASLRITTNIPAAEITIDDVPMGKAPLRDPVVVSAGRRKITAVLRGHAPATKIVEVAGMDSLEVTIELGEPRADGAPEPDTGAGPGTPGSGDTTPERPDDGGSAVPVVMWITTGGLAVATGIVGGLALSASSDLTAKLETFGTSRAEVDDARAKTKNLAITTDVLLGVTAVAAGVSLFVTLSGGGGDKKATTSRPLRLGVGPGSVAVYGAF